MIGIRKKIIQNYLLFTLIELLTIIAIIAMLASMLFPSLREARNVANSTNCKSNLKQLGLGIHLYASDNSETLPCAQSASTGGRIWVSTVAESINNSSGWNFAWTQTTPVSVKKLFDCQIGNEQLCWGVNYNYNKWCGYYQSSWGYPVDPRFILKKINRVKNPSNALLIGDGKSKTYSTVCGDFPVWFDVRHQNKINILWVDGHSSSLKQVEFESLGAIEWMRYVP
ncbi:MAG: hypothetical protein A4E71_00135 [Smithella sp. PtaU1.Bin162]|nr:MAG: hypothetical protein A4E71_00135 [Smithella sp. PtaU1.Bin162]